MWESQYERNYFIDGIRVGEMTYWMTKATYEKSVNDSTQHHS